MRKPLFTALLIIGSFAHGGNEITLAPGDSLHEAIAAKPDTIRLEAGIHRLSETLVLSRQHRGLTIEAASSKPTFIVGSAPLAAESWAPVPDLAGVWKTSLPFTFPEPRSLFIDGKPQPRARSKGYRQLSAPPETVPYRKRRAIDTQHAYLPKEVFTHIKDFAGAELRIIPKYPWVCHVLPITTIDRETSLVYSKVTGTYPMTPTAFGHFPDGTCWIENTLSVIDSPGEWAFNGKSRELFLMTPDGKAPGNRVEIPMLTELIRIEGEEDRSDFEDHPVKHITLRGIRFARSNAYGWEADKTGWGLQHDWEMYDRPTAMIRLRFAESCLIEDCRFVNAGATGVRLDLHCRKNIIRNCEFAELGGAGIVLAGYGMGFKDVNRENLITDNNIHHIGKFWWHSPAIFAWQSGRNRITHNHIHHVPHNAITVSGRTQLSVSGDKESSKTARWDEVIFHLENRDRSWESREPLMHGRYNDIAWNDIHHAMEYMADGNAIYVSGTGTGNRIYHNFIHDIVGPNMNGTIRIDDDQHEVKIDHNIIARCAGEGFLWKGRCEITNNIIYDLRVKAADGTKTEHQRGFMVLGGAPVTGSVVKRNVFVSNNPRYPILFERPAPWIKHGTRKMPPVVLSDADSDHNVYWNSINPNWADDFLTTQRSRGIEKHSVFLDPEFTDPSNNDFTIQQGSLIEQTGFERLDLSAAGPRDETEITYDASKTDFNLENGNLSLDQLAGMSTCYPNLEWLNLYQTRIGNDGARIIGEMRSLTHLPVGETGITDAGLSHLSELVRLEYLGLRGNDISSDGLMSLSDLKALRELNLAQTNVDDRGVKWLSRHFKLEALWLHDTRITNDALEDLATMKTLQKLYLQRTNTTADAIEKLRRELPDCRVFWESDE